jgi:hypothetical protein
MQLTLTCPLLLPADASMDPFKRKPAMRAYVNKYYKAAIKLLNMGGVKYRVDGMYLWNLVSWDVQVGRGGGRGWWVRGWRTLEDCRWAGQVGERMAGGGGLHTRGCWQRGLTRPASLGRTCRAFTPPRLCGMLGMFSPRASASRRWPR